MAPVSLIRVVGTGIIAGSVMYIFGPDLLLYLWPDLGVSEACDLTNPLTLIVAISSIYLYVGWRRLRLPTQSEDVQPRRHQHRYQSSIQALLLPLSSQWGKRGTTSARAQRITLSVRAGGKTKMNLQQHMAMAEQAIAGAFINNGLAIHLCGSLQGPHTLTYGLRLYQPTQPNLNKALRLSGAIEAAIVDSPARVYMDNGLIYVEIPSPTPLVVEGTTMQGQGLAVPIGMTARQTIAGIDFENNPHVLLVGPTNRGKTTAARLLAYHLAKQNRPSEARFIVSTFKPKDWQAFVGLAHTLAIITAPEESAAMIDWLVNLMHRRTSTDRETPHLFIFLDDLLNLLGVADVAKSLKQLASLGRAAGIHLVIGTQRLGETGSGGAAVTGNIPTRVVFGTADAQDAALFSGRGDSGAEKLGRYPGDALIVNDGGTQRVAVGWISNTELSTLPRQPNERRPWLAVKQADTHETAFAQHPEPLPSPTGERPTVPSHFKEGVNGFQGALHPLHHHGTTAMERTLPDQPPNAQERQYLRRLYEQTGSKRATLKAAYGGVVNEDGYTPKTRRWLDEALTEVLA